MDTHVIILLSVLAASLGSGGIVYYARQAKGSQQSDCPCDEDRLCERIKDTTRKEIFVFSLNAKQDDWKFYNWDKVTTVVMVGYFDIQLVCWAHKYGARAITIGGVSTSVLPNRTARSEWIKKQLDFVDKNYLDGINFDYEDAILASQFDLRTGYTNLVKETSQAFKERFPYSMVSVDVAWSPGCIDSRCYDYVGLSEASDLLFVMAYDEQSQIPGECIAGANSGFPRTMSGVQEFLDMGIAADKLVLGVPWYGYYYPCLSLTQDNKCYIRKVPFRGVNCSDAAGREINYSFIIQLLKNSTSGRIFDKTTMTPYFNYKNKSSGIMHQIQYDDPESLTTKYTYAVDQNLRGVGMWNTECVNYISRLSDDILAVKEMWDALPNYTF